MLEGEGRAELTTVGDVIEICEPENQLLENVN